MTGPAILAFDTSAAHCAAAVMRDGQILAEACEPMDRGQAEALLPMLARLLDRAGLGWPDLEAIAVGTGPGNFTGVRIAVAAARGMALGLKIPAIGVSQFEIAAEAAEGAALAAAPAPRGGLYLQPMHDGLAAAAPWLADAPPADASPVWPPARPPAPAIARIAARRLAAGTAVPRPAPAYVRPAEAAPPSSPPPTILP